MPDLDPSQLKLVSAQDSASQLERVKLQLARQYAPRVWRGAIDQLIELVSQGRSLHDSIQRTRHSLPRPLDAILREALSTPDPVGVLIEMLQLRNRIRRHWSSVGLSLAYPIAISIAALVVGQFLGYALTGQESTLSGLYPEVVELNSFSTQNAESSMKAARSLIADQSNVFFGISVMIGWCLAVAVTLRLLGPRWSTTSVICGLPLFGRPYRWLALSEILGQIQLFIAQGKTLEESIRSVERGLVHSGLSRIVGAIGCRVEAGMPFGQSLRMSILSDGLCRPALGQLDRLTDNHGSRIKEIGELMLNLAARRCQLLSAAMPVIVLFFAGSVIWNTIQCYIVFFVAAMTMISAWA